MSTALLVFLHAPEVEPHPSVPMYRRPRAFFTVLQSDWLGHLEAPFRLSISHFSKSLLRRHFIVEDRFKLLSLTGAVVPGTGRWGLAARDVGGPPARETSAKIRCNRRGAHGGDRWTKFGEVMLFLGREERFVRGRRRDGIALGGHGRRARPRRGTV